VRSLGLANAFAIHAVSLFLAALSFNALKLPPSPQSDTAHYATLQGIRQGISYAWGDPVVRTVLLLDALYFAVADGMITTGVPLYVRDVLHAGPEVHGYVQVARNGGMLLGALWLGGLGRRLRTGRIIAWSWAIYGLALLSHWLFPSLAPVLVANVVMGMSGNLIPACGTSLLQERVPQGLLGRVFGVWNTIAPGGGAFSGAIAGVLASVLPATGLLALSAVISWANGLFARRSRLWHQE
jgi:hypothetical protein